MESSHSNEIEPPVVPTTCSLPPVPLTLRGPRIVLKSPTPKDDAVFREIVSDSLTVQHLPHFHRSSGWTLEEIISRRERLIMEQAKGTGLTLFIHLLPNRDGDDSNLPLPNDDDMILAGATGFSRIDLDSGKGEIGIILHHPYWGKGLATESMYLCLLYVFESLGIERVDWVTSVDNRQMRGWCEGLLNMTPVSLRAHDLGDSVEYSLLQSEWHTRVRHFLEKKVYSNKG